MLKIPFQFSDDDYFDDFGTTCYINYEQMVDIFPLYRHMFIEISLILEGEGEVISNGKTYPIQAGHVSIKMPWHFHSIVTKSDTTVRRFICEFSMEEFFHYSSLWPYSRSFIFNDEAPWIMKFNDSDFNKAVHIFNEMYDCFVAKEFLDKQSYLYLKLLEFCMLYYRVQESLETYEENMLDPNNFVNDALKYIHRNFDKNITLASVAKEFGVSSKLLNEKLSAYTGDTFTNLVTEIRIRNACVLLTLKNPTMKYIVKNTGFSSVQAFYRSFKDLKGITPEQFRREYYEKGSGKAGYLMYNSEIWDILFYLKLHFNEPLTPEEVAENFNLSVSYLHKLLKKNLFVSFTDLIRELRISYACGLLLSTDFTTAQVSIEVGYETVKTFTRAFVQQKGITPTAYREANYISQKNEE